MKAKILPFVLILFFLIIFIIFYKGLKNSNIYIPNINIEKKIPSLSLNKFETNEKISQDEVFKFDKFYLINIWASWCIPCRDEHLYLMNLSNNKKVSIIGLNYKDNISGAKNFLNELGNPYSIILEDKDGSTAINLGAYGVPESFLIYQNQIIKKYIGPIDYKTLDEIEEIIK